MPETCLIPPSQPSASTVEPPAEPKRESVKVLLIGSPGGVKNIILTLYRLGFAQVGDWSPLIPTQNSGEVMSILVRRLLV
jgi:hypothetical protein